jgi:hypothetical protein
MIQFTVYNIRAAPTAIFLFSSEMVYFLQVATMCRDIAVVICDKIFQEYEADEIDVFDLKM